MNKRTVIFKTTESLLDEWRDLAVLAADAWGIYQESRPDNDEETDYFDLTDEELEDEIVSSALFGTFSFVHHLVQEKVGDSNRWLDFFHDVCNLGQTPKPVQLPDGTTMTLSTIKQLAELVDESKPGRKWDGLAPPEDEDDDP
jgi:hypothetical protein